MTTAGGRSKVALALIAAAIVLYPCAVLVALLPFIVSAAAGIPFVVQEPVWAALVGFVVLLVVLGLPMLVLFSTLLGGPLAPLYHAAHGHDDEEETPAIVGGLVSSIILAFAIGGLGQFAWQNPVAWGLASIAVLPLAAILLLAAPQIPDAKGAS